jgi:predicted glycosyltransferase
MTFPTTQAGQGVTPLHLDLATEGTGRPVMPKRIWIDLDNSPHVPFFLPIIEELQKRRYKVILTARDSYQVCELLELYRVSCRVVGRHWGKNRALKMLGTCLRALRLIPMMAMERPDLAVSHGSRGQFLCSVVLRIPTLTMYDYEHAAGTGFLPDWAFAPHFIPDSPQGRAKNPEMKYPGLKEDVYVPRFRPDPSLKSQLGLATGDLVVTVRPPATEAHYHNPEAEVLFNAAMNLLIQCSDVRVILLPRNDNQAISLQKQWRQWIEKRKIMVPEHVVDGLNLIWFSDLVISGGGTMNREAAALGVPVYSIFRGKIGAVDRYLAEQGRLTLIENVDEIKTKIKLVRRNRPPWPEKDNRPALQTIVNNIVTILESTYPMPIPQNNACRT